MKTSSTLYVSKVLIRHDRTPNMRGSDNRLRDDTQNQQQKQQTVHRDYKNFPPFSFSSTAALHILTNHALARLETNMVEYAAVGSISLWNQSERSVSLIVTTILLWIFAEVVTPGVMVNNKREVTHLRAQYMKYSSSKSPGWIQNHPQGLCDLVCETVCLCVWWGGRWAPGGSPRLGLGHQSSLFCNILVQLYTEVTQVPGMLNTIQVWGTVKNIVSSSQMAKVSLCPHVWTLSCTKGTQRNLTTVVSTLFGNLNSSQATSDQHVDISGTPKICLPRQSLIHLSCWDTTLAVDHPKHTHTTSQRGSCNISHTMENSMRP